MKRLFLIFFFVGALFAQLSPRVPRLEVIYRTLGADDTMLYAPCDGKDTYSCWAHGYTPTCDSSNYGDSWVIAMKEDWRWTRRGCYIEFDTTLPSGYDSLLSARIYLYKVGTATNTNFIQAYVCALLPGMNTHSPRSICPVSICR